MKRILYPGFQYYIGDMPLGVLKKRQESIALEVKQRQDIGSLSSSMENIVLYDRPVNSDAKNIVIPCDDPFKKVKENRKRIVQVYLIRFKEILNPSNKFLKIGITNNLKKRFGDDMLRFEITLIETISGLLRSEALEIEKRLLDMFKDKKHNPGMKILSGGNSECFVDDNDIIYTTLQCFQILQEELDKH